MKGILLIKPISTTTVPVAIEPYEQTIKTNGMVYTSGQLPINPATGTFLGGIEAQTRQSLNNVSAILGETGTGMMYVVKTTVLLGDMNNFATMNDVYAVFWVKALILPTLLSKLRVYPKMLWLRSKLWPRLKSGFAP